VLQPGEVGLHKAGVACEVLVTHVREAAQAEYHLTAAWALTALGLARVALMAVVGNSNL
jgi:hypothetical protein